MLAAIWAALIVWQTGEHLRGRQAFQNMVVDHGRSVSTTCGVLLRSRSFFGVVSQERLEAALNELVSTRELRSVKLLNFNGEAVASAGVPFDLPRTNDLQGGVLWSNDTVLVENPVDLGTNVPQLILPRGGNEPRSPIRHQCPRHRHKRPPFPLQLARPGPPLLDDRSGVQNVNREKGRPYFRHRHVH
jgi:hypothetical protein